MLKYVWTKFEILTPYISWDTVHFVKFWQFAQKLLLHFYIYFFSIGYNMEKVFAETSQKEFFDAFMMIWVDLTAEIKISKNVLSLLAALYSRSQQTFHVFDVIVQFVVNRCCRHGTSQLYHGLLGSMGLYPLCSFVYSLGLRPPGNT